ncbi:hypothetical protein NM208_g852 [Fusarium decemcellulare]|uniref:Uncharacterized protein n=1 Tax=Fusarium decemcellulare TaxID=57161 RepID=A0ACC1SY13_9HYPO|nr:hypothetical protein NM208_g852 [Fusarium decemcellulare]
MAAVRRSARIRNIELGVPPEPPKPAPAKPQASRKRKPSTKDEGVEGAPKGKKRGATGRAGKLGKPTVIKEVENTSPEDDVSPPLEAPDDALSTLPAEILQSILENVNHPPSMIKLACTSKRYYTLIMAVLHKRINVAVSFWAHIPNVIRRLEPHLSIAQKKQLKREGKYKGQQEKFSTRLDPLAVPPCADYVRQMVIGNIDPGKKHKPIVLRYLEEVLKNLPNLEVIDTDELTLSMAENIASRKNLKALRIYAFNSSTYESIKEETALPLKQLRNLEHLNIQSPSWSALVTNDNDILQSILLNSLSTLKSLDIYTSKWGSDFLADWEDQIKARNPNAMKQAHDFTALKSLSLRGVRFIEDEGPGLMQTITRAVDFLQLRELKLADLDQGKLTFFKHLEDLFSKAEKGTVQLRKLSLDMDADAPNSMAAEVLLEGIYRFISSFDTLGALHFHDYNKYNDGKGNDPGLSRTIQQVIVKHKDLESLRFSYRGLSKIPLVSAKTLRILTKNLPRLRELEFCPEETEMDELTLALSHAKNLTTLMCPYFHSGDYQDRSIDRAFALLEKLIEGLLENAGDTSEFAWEKSYELRRVFVSWRQYEIGSDLKPRKNMKDPVTIRKGTRQVMCQDLLARDNSKQFYYTAEGKWVDEITRPMY